MFSSKIRATLVLSALVSFIAGSSAYASPQLTAVERTKLLPETPLLFGWSGSSVAACGDLTVVGSPEGDIFFDHSPGRAVVYKRDGSRWNVVTTLTASDGAVSDHFGRAVAIAPDSSRVAVGAFRAGPGAVYLFEPQLGGWVEQQKLVAPDATFGFGISVDLSGSTVVVGASSDSQMVSGSGAIYVFESNQVVKLKASDPQSGSNFGGAVALDALSSQRIVVGAPFQFSNPTHPGGRAYVFRKTPAGWVEEARLAPASLSPGDNFGSSVAIRGTHIVVGAASTSFAGTGSGSVFAFEFDGTTWVEQQEFSSPSGAPGDHFGSSLSLGQDLLAVGAPTETQAGSAHVFEQAASGWIPALELQASDGLPGDFMGNSVALGGDWVLVGAEGVSADSSNLQSGAAYCFEFGQTFATPFCFGDGSGVACPCGNESSLGGGEGCRGNGEASRLRAFGSNDVTADDLRILGDFGLPTTVMLFTGSNLLGGGNGIQVGGGLMCMSGNVQRLGVRFSSPCGQAEWGTNLASQAGWNPGQTVNVQAWVRTPGSSCNGFNFSSALEVLLAP